MITYMSMHPREDWGVIEGFTAFITIMGSSSSILGMIGLLDEDRVIGLYDEWDTPGAANSIQVGLVVGPGFIVIGSILALTYGLLTIFANNVFRVETLERLRIAGDDDVDSGVRLTNPPRIQTSHALAASDGVGPGGSQEPSSSPIRATDTIPIWSEEDVRRLRQFVQLLTNDGRALVLEVARRSLLAHAGVTSQELAQSVGLAEGKLGGVLSGVGRHWQRTMHSLSPFVQSGGRKHSIEPRLAELLLEATAETRWV